MDEKLCGAFGYAVETENMEMFDYLMKNYAGFKKKDKIDLLLKVVLHSKTPRFVQRLLKAGADINYKDEQQNTLLHYAAASCHVEVVRFFIEQGLALEAKNDRDATPLCIAAKESDSPNVIKLLMDSGADIHVRSNHGESLLITAAGCNPNPKVTKLLLTKGFGLEDRDEGGYTPLLNAALYQSNTDVLDLLVQAGADIHAVTDAGDTLFHLAARNPNPEIAKYLRGEFLTSERNNRGESCIEMALGYAKNAEVVKVYLEAVKEEQAMYACMNENPEVLEALIHAGYGVNTTDGDGVSLFMLAAKLNPNPFIILTLLNHNAIWNNKDSKGRTVLHYAAVNEEPEMYDFMLDDKLLCTLAKEEDASGHTAEYYRAHQNEF